jgi:hypothetical protein
MVSSKCHLFGWFRCTKSRRVFLNGVELGISSTGGTIAALDAYANSTSKNWTYEMKLIQGSSTAPSPTSVSTTTALTADEIWELYAYQKEYFGVSPDVVTLKAGSLGIGTSEPRAVLDVRGGHQGWVSGIYDSVFTS